MAYAALTVSHLSKRTFPSPRHPGYNRGMSEERKEPTVAWFHVVMIHRSSGVDLSYHTLLDPETVPAFVEMLKSKEAFRDIRVEPSEEPQPFFPPERWAGFEPLEYDNELPPLDRPKIP